MGQHGSCLRGNAARDAEHGNANTTVMGSNAEANVNGENNDRVLDFTHRVSSDMSPTLALGAGCFWGTEKFILKDFQTQFPGSVKKTQTGFIQIDSTKESITNPTCEMVSTGRYGFVEVVRVELSNPEDDFENLIRFFFGFHDPTEKNRQGSDRGQQYASCIYVTDQEQRNVAERVQQELQQRIASGKVTCFQRKTIATLILDMQSFTSAAPFHQQYLLKNRDGYCNHFIRKRAQRRSVIDGAIGQKWRLRVNFALPFLPAASS